MSVFKHGNAWWYNFSCAGVRYCERTNAKTRDQAIQLQAQREAELRANGRQWKSQKRAPLFRSFAFGDFATWCAAEHRDRPSTYSRYMRSVKVLAGFLGSHGLTAINAGHLEQYKIWRSQQRRKHARDGRLVSPAAVNRDLAVLRILFNYAVRLGLVTKNPVVGVRFFRERQNHTRVLASEEEVRYLNAASPFLRDVAIVMLETGMRPGEIYRLRREDVDFSLRSVQVRSGKTCNAARHIPLTERASAILKTQIAQVQTVWLFPCPFSPTTHVLDVRKAHDAAVRRAKIFPPFRLYDLRHTALTRMAMSGIDLPTLKKLAGHSQI